ncbi:hypothetical protein [Baekduia alba]|uniref:hypothetical protein n=1 Tax=Baekduia alba TaxID=2997333 RepID=UPI002340BECE|nr:hypothetical protein [Baekduia alba]
MAVVALVAVLLGTTGAALAQAGFLGRRVTRELARAVCVVSAGDCWRDREPCVVGSSSDAAFWKVGIAIVRVGKDRLALVERRSDGTVAVTLEGAWRGGAEASVGTPRVAVKLKGIDFSAGGELTASLLARLGDGRTWIVGSEAEARALVAAGGSARPPDVTYGDRAWLSTLSATLGADVMGTGEGLDVASAQVAFDQHWGTATDHRTGHRTTSIHASWSGSVALLRDVLGATGGDDGPVVAVEADAAGRPLDLRITTTGTFGGSRDLPGAVQPVAGLLAARAGAGADRRYEVTAHLDLTDPRDLAAARELLAAIDGKHARTTPGPELRRLLDARATIEARVLAERSTGHDAELSGGTGGAQLGYSEHSEHHDRELLAASSRGLDGQWITRTDCVA